jgi:hypothetical protein
MNNETSVSGKITRRADAPSAALQERQAQPGEQASPASAAVSGKITVKRSDPDYIRQYYHARKAQNPEYYGIYSLKKYYRKQLSLIDGIEGNNDNEARKAKILSKLESLDAKLKNIKESREKYNRWKQPQKTELNDESSSAV